MRLRIAVAVLLLASPAGAADVPRSAEEARSISPFVQALYSNMALNWICRDAIGIASYQAARVIAIDSIAKYRGRNQAVLDVDYIDNKFRHDPRRFPNLTAQRCYELKADAMHKIEVEKAKLESE